MERRPATATVKATGEVEQYESVREAAVAMIRNGAKGSMKNTEGLIFKALTGARKSAFGRTWEYGERPLIEDVFGCKWASYSQMCSCRPVRSYGLYAQRVKAGWSEDDALMTPPRSPLGSVADAPIGRRWSLSNNASAHKVSLGSNRWFKFLCQACGREFPAKPNSIRRSQFCICPECRKKMQASAPEIMLFNALRRFADPSAVANPDPCSTPDLAWLDHMKPDVYLPSLATVVEYDGPLHDQQKTRMRDERKSELCAQHGVRLIRVREPELSPWALGTDVVIMRADNYSAESLLQVVREVLVAVGVDRSDVGSIADEDLITGIDRNFSDSELRAFARGRECKDHAGRVYPSARAMARAWGIPHYVLATRRRRGWGLERALETPVREYTSSSKLDA